MAKNKKSKILAMALCASVMTGIYAAPVMAAEVDVTSGNLTGVTAQGHGDYSFTGGTLYLDDAGIAGALNGRNVNLGAITANSITSTAGITAAGGNFQVYGGSGGIAATSLSLLKNDNGIKSQNVLITNSGMARFGDSNSENVRIENGVLRVLDGNTELASLTSNGLTLNDGTVQGSLTATQLATINSAITTQNNKTVITGDELNIKGASGGLYVRDVVDGKKTMIYTKAADDTNTVWIDPENGNISTIGTVGVTDDLKSGKLITQIQGYDPKNPENTGDIAVGIKADGTQMIHLDASRGSITAANFNGVKLATNGDQVLVGDIDVKNLYDKTEGIDRTVINGARTTTIETVTSFDANGMVVSNENDGRKVAITNNRGIEVFGGNDVSNAVIAHNGTARFGALNGANVLVENGVLTVNSTGETDVAKLDAQGLTLTSGATEATLSAEQIARLNKVVTQNGKSIVVTADHFKNTKESFAVDSNGAVKAANGKFNVGADGKVAIQYAKDGAIVANENGFAVQKGSAQTVVTNVGVANIYDDNRVEVNANGVGLAAGLKADGSAAAQISVTDDGIGLQGGTSEVVLNSNNGAVFTNGEGNGETVINGGSITTNRITTGTVNGVAIGMNDDGDITLGNNVVIDGDFNSDNIAGITRVDLNDSEPGSEVTYIEKNTAVSADGIVVTDPNTGVSTKTKYDGFYVKDETGNNVSRLTKDRLALAGKKLAVADSEGNIDVSASTYTAGDVTAENVRVKSDGIYVKNGSEILNSLTAEGLTLGEQQLTEEKIAEIGGIDRSYDEETNSYTTTIEKALSISDDGSFATTNGSFSVDAEGNLYSTNGTVTVQTRENLAAVQLGQTTLGMSDEDITMSVGRGTAIALSKYTGINLSSGGNNIALNSDGAVFTNDNIEGSTVIKGGSVTTGTITADDLHVDNIYLGNQIVDEEGNVVGSDLAIGADGSIKIADNFEVDTDNLAAHYVGEDDEYELTLDGTNGFALRNSEASLTLNDSGYTFSGPVNLGAGDEVGFTYAKGTGNEKYYTLDSLVDKVNDIYDRTDGIYKDAEGNTVISNEQGEWNEDTKQTEHEGIGSKVTIGKDGATFENGADNGITNVNGGTVNTDSALVGDHESTAGGGTGTGATGDGTVTDSTAHSGQFADADSSYEFTNDANGFTGTVTGDNTSASSGVGIGNDGAFISDSVTNGDMTVTEVKDENGSATTVKDANGSSTVSQKTNGQTVSTGTGTSVNTGDDFSVTDTETGKSIYMSDIGHVEDIDSEIQNSDGSKTTVVDAVNNEAEIRRNEIERVDGRINNLENRVGKLEDRIDKVGAMAAAIANLRTMGYDPAAPTEVAVGIGQYRDETGAALGLFHYPNRDFMLSLSVSTSGDEVMGGIGATWKFGRKSPEKVAEIKKAQAEADARRAEEAKLAKAEEMKQAAKEAKIKAQQERHAKLAAERAAQAEAAK